MTKPLKFYVAMPLEIHGPVVCHMTHWLMRLPAFIGSFALDTGHGNDVPAVRNLLVHRFLRSDADVLWFVDSDMDPRLGSNEADIHGGAPFIREAMERDDVDIVSGISFRIGGKGPSLCLHDAKGKLHVHENVLASKTRGLIDGADLMTGGACLAIRRRVLEGFLEKKRVWFKNHLEEEDPRQFGLLRQSEDFHFIATAKELGYRFWVDTRVVWGHIKPRDLREELWMAEELIAQAKADPAVLGEAKPAAPRRGRLVEIARG